MRIIAGFHFVALVAVNIIQTLVQPSAAAPSTGNATETGSGDGSFAAMLASEPASDGTAQSAAQPANDTAPVSNAQVNKSDSNIVTAPVGMPDAPIILPETIAALLQTTAPKMPDAGTKTATQDNKPANDTDSSQTGDNTALAALMLPQQVQQVQQVQQAPKQVPMIIGGAKQEAPAVGAPQQAPTQPDAPQMPVGQSAAPVTPFAPDDSKSAAPTNTAQDNAPVPQEPAKPVADIHAKTGKIELPAEFGQNNTPGLQDSGKPKPAASDARVNTAKIDKTAKIELPKEITQAAPEKVTAPVVQSKNSDGQPAQPQTAADSSQSDTPQQGQQQQPHQQDKNVSEVQASVRTDAPQISDNGNISAPQPAQPIIAKADLPVAPQGAGLDAVTAPAQANNTVTNTAATLHAVSTMRDTSATPDTRSMAVQIASFSSNDVKHFEIKMDPAELGRVDVHLTLGDDGKAQASLIVEKPHTLELLQKDSPALERALKDAGIDLSNNGLNFSLKGQEHQQDSGARAGSRMRGNPLKAIANLDAPILSGNHFSSGKSGLDIHV